MALNVVGAKPSAPASSATPFLVIALVGTLVMTPALMARAMRHGVDSIFHARWMQHFATQFWNGEVYPRWLMDMNDGFGSPAFFIYPPFSQFVTALLHPVSPNAPVILLGISAWFAVTASGLTCFLWLRRALPGHEMAAVVGALVYMLAPYHLYVDVYQRGALAEVWAFVWPPISLMLVHRLDRFHAANLAGLALSIAALLATHAPSCLILVPAYFLHAILLDRQDRKYARTLRLIIACALGAMLAGWYLGPALTHTRYIDTTALFSGRNASSNWLIGGGAWPDPAIQRDIYVAVALQGAVGLIAAILSLLRSRRGEVALPVAALLLALIPLFMMSILSKPIWDLGLPLNRVQFPWRFSILLSLASTLAVALLISRLVAGRSLIIAIPAALFAANVLLFLFPAQHPLAATVIPVRVADDSWDAPEYRLARKTETDGVFAPGEHARLTSGTGTLKVTAWRPRLIVLETDIATPSIIALRQFRYSGWTLSALPRKDDVTLEEGRSFLQVATPPGRHTLRLELAETVEERWGKISSGVALAAILCLFGLDILKRRRRRARAFHC